MKKISLTLLLILSITIYSFAQGTSGGFKGGLNLANIRGDDAGNPSIRAAFHLGGFVNLKASEVVSIQPELLFNSFGAKESVLGTDVTMKSNYISVPIMIICSFGNFNIQAGPQLGFLTSARMKVKYSGQSEEGDVKELFNTTDFGLNLGFGVDFEKFSTSARYYLGLSRIYDEDLSGEVDAKNGVIQLSLGYALFGN